MRYFIKAFISFWLFLSIGTSGLLLAPRLLGSGRGSETPAAGDDDRRAGAELFSGLTSAEAALPQPRISRGPDLPDQGPMRADSQ